jgi:hypothetical protein
MPVTTHLHARPASASVCSPHKSLLPPLPAHAYALAGFAAAVFTMVVVQYMSCKQAADNPPCKQSPVHTPGCVPHGAVNFG